MRFLGSGGYGASRADPCCSISQRLSVRRISFANRNSTAVRCGHLAISSYISLSPPAWISFLYLCRFLCSLSSHDKPSTIDFLSFSEICKLLQPPTERIAMARRKQAVPLQREPSDFDKGPPESPNHGWKQSNGNDQASKLSIANGPFEPEKLPPSIIEQAGPLQLVICAGGIYVSL